MRRNLPYEAIPQPIIDYLTSHHVLSVAGMDEQGLWAANCFYVWSPVDQGFVILSSLKTRHGRIMLDSPQVCGTVVTQEQTIAHLQGIQYSAKAVLLRDEAEKQARKLYYEVFPIARAKPAPVWLLEVQSLKMTNNRLGFGHKTSWQRIP
ncbi:PNPOx family protein [Celerinatantimonas diazotrophica]|nr:hypothetical protein [Celerinatantimonas diazotrophica]